jgi:hypothetical protein
LLRRRKILRCCAPRNVPRKHESASTHTRERQSSDSAHCYVEFHFWPFFLSLFAASRVIGRSFIDARNHHHCSRNPKAPKRRRSSAKLPINQIH